MAPESASRRQQRGRHSRSRQPWSQYGRRQPREPQRARPPRPRCLRQPELDQRPGLSRLLQVTWRQRDWPGTAPRSAHLRLQQGPRCLPLRRRRRLLPPRSSPRCGDDHGQQAQRAWQPECSLVVR
ncbi:hypothetical protein ACFPRL_26560 [Pseudoclavibacter helvolus]